MEKKKQEKALRAAHSEAVKEVVASLQLDQQAILNTRQVQRELRSKFQIDASGAFVRSVMT